MGVEHQETFAIGYVRQETGRFTKHDTEHFHAALNLTPAQVSTAPCCTVASQGIGGDHFELALGCREDSASVNHYVIGISQEDAATCIVAP
jgi:hypothetical protein